MQPMSFLPLSLLRTWSGRGLLDYSLSSKAYAHGTSDTKVPQKLYLFIAAAHLVFAGCTTGVHVSSGKV